VAASLAGSCVSPVSESPADWPMCWSCGDVTVDGVGCRICRRQHHAFCARKGRKLVCTQVKCFEGWVCNLCAYLLELFSVRININATFTLNRVGVHAVAQAVCA
jgi:hypothetical protein